MLLFKPCMTDKGVKQEASMTIERKTCSVSYLPAPFRVPPKRDPDTQECPPQLALIEDVVPYVVLRLVKTGGPESSPGLS